MAEAGCGGLSWEGPTGSCSVTVLGLFFPLFCLFFPLPFLAVEKDVVCRWRRHGWSIQGTRPSLGIMPGSLGDVGRRLKLCIFRAISGVFQVLIPFHREKKKKIREWNWEAKTTAWCWLGTCTLTQSSSGLSWELSIPPGKSFPSEWWKSGKTA